MRLEQVGYDDPRAISLIAAFQAEMDLRYPGTAPTPAAVQDFVPPGAFVLAVDDAGASLACGGVRPHDDGGEVKKLYAVAAVRGTGAGRTVLRALADHGRARGWARLVLQTGTQQPEAVGLYESEGWTPIPVYGPYADDPRCRCFALDLGPGR